MGNSMTSESSLGVHFAKACLFKAFSSVQHIKSCVSTSALAKEWGHLGERHASLVIASNQTQGRGRRGRTWLTHEGALAFSLFLKPPELKPMDATAYTFLAGAALIEALAGDLPVFSKWPNDILIQRDAHTYGKVAGILVEAANHKGKMQGLVVGIGVNVRDPQGGFPVDLPWASSLQLEYEDSQAKIFELLAESLERWLTPLNAYDNLSKALEILDNNSVLAGKTIRVSDGGQPVSGLFGGVGEDGALLLRPNDGQTLRILTGDVIFEGYGHHV
jgi:BirA family transcriptional regulator, biotin operon repressor / biotin---[acetyl-CoA-carboxylase] ligase